MVIRSFTHGLYMVECGDTQVLYDINRVKTYDCNRIEATFFRQDTGGSTDLYDKQNLAEAQERLHYLSRLSTSLTAYQGITSSFTGHPSQLFVNICRNCNLQCNYCYDKECKEQEEKRRMSPETAHSGIDFLLSQAKPGEAYVVIFAGGEPLLNFPVLASTAEYARKRCQELGVALKLRVLSNGTVMDDKILKLLIDYDIFLQISLDGPPEIHDQHRPDKNGLGSSKKILETISYLKHHGFSNYKVRGTLCHGNADISRIAEFYNNEGLENFVFRPIMVDKDHSHQLSQSDLSKITCYFTSKCSQLVASLQTGKEVDIPEAFSMYMNRLQIGVKIKTYCGAGREMVVMSPEGRFYPCPVFADNANYCIGELGSGNNGGKPFPNLSVDEKQVCRQCWARNLCGGGCVSQAIRHMNDPLQPDPSECAVMLAKIKGAIVLHHLQERNKRGGRMKHF